MMCGENANSIRGTAEACCGSCEGLLSMAFVVETRCGGSVHDGHGPRRTPRPSCRIAIAQPLLRSIRERQLTVLTCLATLCSKGVTKSRCPTQDVRTLLAKGMAKVMAKGDGMASAESSMKTSDGWQQYLSELVNARPAPAVDAFQWARGPRCVQQGSGHPRIGETALKGVICRLWDHGRARSWK